MQNAQVLNKLSEDNEFINSSNIYEFKRQIFYVKIQHSQSISSFIVHLELIMSELKDMDDIIFMDFYMISKFFSNLLISFEGLFLAWESTTKDNQNLFNPKLHLQTEKNKILLWTQNDLIIEWRAFYARHRQSFNARSYFGQSTSRSYNPTKLNSYRYLNESFQNYPLNILGPISMLQYPSSSSWLLPILSR